MSIIDSHPYGFIIEDIGSILIGRPNMNIGGVLCEVNHCTRALPKLGSHKENNLCIWTHPLVVITHNYKLEFFLYNNLKKVSPSLLYSGGFNPNKKWACISFFFFFHVNI